MASYKSTEELVKSEGQMTQFGDGVIGAGGKRFKLSPTGYEEIVPEATQQLAIAGTPNAITKVEQGQRELDRMQGINTLNAFNQQMVSAGQQPKQEPTQQQPQLQQQEQLKQTGKITFLNENNQKQVLEGEGITPEAYQNLVNQGYYAIEGTGNVPTWASVGDIQTGRMNAEIQKSQKEIADLTETMKSYFISDATLQIQIDDIAKQYEKRIREMEDINKRRTESVKTMGIRMGSRWTGGAGGVWGGIITEEEKQGQERITDLQNQKTAAINTARTAAKDKNWTIFSKQLDLAKENEKQQREALKEYNQKVVEENKKVAEQTKKASRDSAIMGLISQGITDPTQLWDYLNFNEEGEQVGDITTDEIVKVLDNLQKATKSENLQGDVGEWQDALKSGGIPKETTLMDYIEMKKKAQQLPKEPKLLSPTEVAVLGVPYGTTEEEAAKKGIIPKRYKETIGDEEKKLSVLDVQRYNELYPDADVIVGDTEASANAKVVASKNISIEDKTKNLIQLAKDNGSSYEEVIKEIQNDNTIKDKESALQSAKKIYGKTTKQENVVINPPKQNFIDSIMNSLFKPFLKK